MSGGPFSLVSMELERLLIVYWTDEDREELGEGLLRTPPSEGHVREVFEVALAERLDTDPLDLIRKSLFWHRICTSRQSR